MANTLTGRVIEARPTQTVTSKSGTQFTKRELILDCTRYDPYTGERGFDNTPVINFMQDRCSLLDNILPGMIVTVGIDITGRKLTDSDKYYNDVRGYRVDIIRNAEAQPMAQQPVSQPMPMAQPMVQQPIQAVPQYQQPQQYQQPYQQAYQQPVYPDGYNPYGAQQPYGETTEQNTGLPF